MTQEEKQKKLQELKQAIVRDWLSQYPELSHERKAEMLDQMMQFYQTTVESQMTATIEAWKSMGAKSYSRYQSKKVEEKMRGSLLGIPTGQKREFLNLWE